MGNPPAPRWTVVLAASTMLAAGMTAGAAPPAGAEAGRTALAAARPALSVRFVDGLRAATAAPRADADPTQQAIPAVKAAVRAARRGDPIPHPLVPPVGDLLHDQFPPIPDCWGLRHEPDHLRKCTLVAGTEGTIVLIGDSHAREWLTPIVRLAKVDGWRLIPLWHIGCWPTTYDAGRECQDFIGWAKRQVRRLRPDVVLIGGALKYRTAEAITETAANIASLVRAVEPSADHVALIGDPPKLRFQPTQCLSSADANLGTCGSKLTPAQIAAYLASEKAATGAGGKFLNTIRWFCFEMRFPAVVGHTATYREDDHIAHSYGLRVAYRFHAAFKRMLSTQLARRRVRQTPVT